MELKDLGFSDWFKKRLKEPQQLEPCLARVIAVNKNKYLVRNEVAEIPAEITGKLIYQAETSQNLPTVGDWVKVQYLDNNTFAIINEILPRKTLLKRKVAGKKITYQLIASNVDIAYIVQSCDFDFNLRRLERYLIMVTECDIKPIILLSKRDLIPTDNLQQEILKIKNLSQEYQIISFSNFTGEGLDQVKRTLKKGKTYCLIGSSGVGKTTLLNKLIGKKVFTTKAVRQKDGKGRHATARRHLVILEQGGLIIDTPGLRELGNIGVESGLNETFADIVALAQVCRFKNCAHTSEPGCSVLEAVEKGKISKERYNNYIKIRNESEYYEMSYFDKRRKDKQFGKMVKSAKKNFRKK